MATRGPLGRAKRERERARAEKHKQKVVRREEAKVRREQGGPQGGAEDRDIAGIVPGPQLNPWGDEPIEEEKEEETQ